MFKGFGLLAMYMIGLASSAPGGGDLWVKYLMQAPLAACLVWFMIRLERILNSHTKSINNLIRSQMVTVMTFHESGSAAKTEAKRIIEDIEAED